jgi:hypothetical protein
MEATGMARTPQELVEEVVRDLDLVVYRLERPPAVAPELERAAVRRELERLRDLLAALPSTTP